MVVSSPVAGVHDGLVGQPVEAVPDRPLEHLAAGDDRPVAPGPPWKRVSPVNTAPTSGA